MPVINVPTRSKHWSTRQVELPEPSELMGRVTNALRQRTAGGKSKAANWTSKVRRAAETRIQTKR
jgi:hypothetical protein